MGPRAEAMGWEATSPCASPSREPVLAAECMIPSIRPSLSQRPSRICAPCSCPLFFFTGYRYFYILFFCELLACFWLLHSVYIAIWVIKTQCMILRMIQYLMDCDCFSWPCNLWAIHYSLIANCCCCWNVVAKHLELWFITNIAAKPHNTMFARNHCVHFISF